MIQAVRQAPDSPEGAALQRLIDEAAEKITDERAAAEAEAQAKADADWDRQNRLRMLRDDACWTDI